MARRRFIDRRTLSWALYDWANSAFATVVLAGFFPVFFKRYWSSGNDLESTFQLGLANSLASLTVLCLAPLLGTIADIGGLRKRMLLAFALLGMIMTAGLYGVAAGASGLALTLFVLAAIGFSTSIVFYDALLLAVAEPRTYDRVSALGYALGYLGGGLLFLVAVLASRYPEWFGFSDAGAAVRASFLWVALWWCLFSLPLWFWVPEPPGVFTADGERGLVAVSWKRLVDTLRHVRELRPVALFLLAYWLYIDGVDTIVRMAVDYGLALGFSAADLMVALLITQFVGFPAALVFGHLGERFGPKAGIYVALAVYLGVTLWAYTMERVAEFYALAVAIGLVQGGIQSLSRSLYARLIPRQSSAEFFGFYNMLGKFAALIGPFMVGAVGMASGDHRTGILSLLLLFVAGGVLLWFVDDGRQKSRKPP